MTKPSWPVVPLGEVVRQRKEFITIDDARLYKRCRVQLHAHGVVLRDTVSGAEIKTKRQQVCRAGEFLVAEIDAKVGGYGLVPAQLDGAVVSSHYFLFELDGERLDERFLDWYVRTPAFRDQVRAQGTTNYAAIRPAHVLSYEMPLPSLPEQGRIVERLAGVAGKVRTIRQLQRASSDDSERLLRTLFTRLTADAPVRRLGEVAPLTRRPIAPKPGASYPQVAVRSFGRGTFHHPALRAEEITWQRPYLVKAGDILISNIKAWEGAIAVAQPADDERVGSHRYLTLVPEKGVASAHFLTFYLLTAEGLNALGEASPGSADRNRTLSTKALAKMPVPVPGIDDQLWFEAMLRRARSMDHTRAELAAELDALVPSVMDRVFAGLY